MFLFPATVFGLLLMLLGVGCPAQMMHWETEDRAAIAAGASLAPGATPDALRLSTALWLGVLPLLIGSLLVVRGYRQARNQHAYGEPNPDLRVREPGELILRTVRLIGTRALTLATSDISLGRRHEGRAATVSPDLPFAEGIHVHAPWHVVRLPGRRLPLILDDQGWFASGRPDR